MNTTLLAGWVESAPRPWSLTATNSAGRDTKPCKGSVGGGFRTSALAIVQNQHDKNLSSILQPYAAKPGIPSGSKSTTSKFSSLCFPHRHCQALAAVFALDPASCSFLFLPTLRSMPSPLSPPAASHAMNSSRSVPGGERQPTLFRKWRSAFPSHRPWKPRDDGRAGQLRILTI